MPFLYLILTRSDSVLSHMIHRTTGESFTHVSLTFDEMLPMMVSFGRKTPHLPFPAGLVLEHPDRGFWRYQRDIPCALYRIAVTDEQYEQVRRHVYDMLGEASVYRYNVLGLLLCRLRIPLERRRRYFCSQFVASSLAECLPLPKPPSLMHPSDFCRIDGMTLIYSGGLYALRDALRGIRSRLPHQNRPAG